MRLVAPLLIALVVSCASILGIEEGDEAPPLDDDDGRGGHAGGAGGSGGGFGGQGAGRVGACPAMLETLVAPIESGSTSLISDAGLLFWTHPGGLVQHDIAMDTTLLLAAGPGIASATVVTSTVLVPFQSNDSVTVARVPYAGGMAQVAWMRPGSEEPKGIAVFHPAEGLDYAYVAVNASKLLVGGPSSLMMTEVGLPVGTRALDLAHDGVTMYVALGSVGIQQFALPNGPLTAFDNTQALDVAVRGDHVYFTTATGLERRDKATGQLAESRAMVTGAIDLAVDDRAAFVLTSFELHCVPHDDSEIVVHEGLQAGASVALDDGAVYVIHYEDGDTVISRGLL